MLIVAIVSTVIGLWLWLGPRGKRGWTGFIIAALGGAAWWFISRQSNDVGRHASQAYLPYRPGERVTVLEEQEMRREERAQDTFAQMRDAAGWK